MEEDRIRAAYARRPKGDSRALWSDAGHVFTSQERERQMLGVLGRAGLMPLTGKAILEVGCGTGTWLREFIKWGAYPEDVVGVDIRPDVLIMARAACPTGVRIEAQNGARLEFPDESFDVVLQASVFTSVLDPAVRGRIAAEMLRVVRPQGSILWYDFHTDNPWNRDVRGVRKGEIRSLFPHCTIALQRVTLAPPLTRRVARISWLASYCLARIPLLCTHYLGVIRKPAPRR
jgi:ubiquinone/menaquinone biosynthesis C-methylase UbiE